MFELILLIAALFIGYMIYEHITKLGCQCNYCKKEIRCDQEICHYCGKKQIQGNFEFIDDSTTLKERIEEDLDGIVVALMAKVAMQDGLITKTESDYIKQRYEELYTLTHKDDSVLIIYDRIFKKEKEDQTNIILIASKLKDLEDDAKRYVYVLLKGLADLDGNHDNLENIRNAMGYFPSSQTSPYALLESSPEDSLLDIEKNYRRLIKEQSKKLNFDSNIPEEMIRHEEAKLQALDEAWDVVKKEKNA